MLLLFSLDATPQSKLHLFLFVRGWGHVSRTDACSSHLKIVKVADNLLIKLLRAQILSILTQKQLRQVIDQFELPQVLISFLFLLSKAHHLVSLSMTALAYITGSFDQVIIQEVVDLNLRLVALMSYFVTTMKCQLHSGFIATRLLHRRLLLSANLLNQPLAQLRLSQILVSSLLMILIMVVLFPLLLHLKDTFLYLLAIERVYSTSFFLLVDFVVILEDTAIICSVQALRVIIDTDTDIDLLIGPHNHIVYSLLD